MIPVCGPIGDPPKLKAGMPDDFVEICSATWSFISKALDHCEHCVAPDVVRHRQCRGSAVYNALADPLDCAAVNFD